jgi:hypothetical protein
MVAKLPFKRDWATGALETDGQAYMFI